MSGFTEVRIGVIGAGGRGHLAWHAHKPEDGVRLMAGADVNDLALSEFKDRFGPDTFITADYRRFWSGKT